MIIFISKLNKDGSRMKLRRRLITLDEFMVTSDFLEQTKHGGRSCKAPNHS